MKRKEIDKKSNIIAVQHNVCTCTRACFELSYRFFLSPLRCFNWKYEYEYVQWLHKSIIFFSRTSSHAVTELNGHLMHVAWLRHMPTTWYVIQMPTKGVGPTENLIRMEKRNLMSNGASCKMLQQIDGENGVAEPVLVKIFYFCCLWI